MGRPTEHLEALRAGLVAGDRASLGRCLTLVESTRPADRRMAAKLLDALVASRGNAYRVGISGVPGVGKSTFIDAFGGLLIAQGLRVAVLAVDPSSTRTGGSILADKTRMTRLSMSEQAFIRPSPSSGTLGGVAQRTRECVHLCEAAGFDVVLIETVGVGQSETMVADMSDFFLVLMLAGAGDEIQGIKRGILEVADCLAVNKADGDNRQAALRAVTTYAGAMALMSRDSTWTTQVHACSAETGEGLEAIWATVQEHRQHSTESGALEERRRDQDVQWFWSMVDTGLRQRLRSNGDTEASLQGLERDVRGRVLSPTSAAEGALDLLTGAS